MTQQETENRFDEDSSGLPLYFSYLLSLHGELGHLAAINLLRRHDAKIAKNDKAKNRKFEWKPQFSF